MRNRSGPANQRAARAMRGTVPHASQRFGLIPADGPGYRPGNSLPRLHRFPGPSAGCLAESDLNTQTRPETFRLRAGNFNLLVLRLLDHRPDAVLPSLGDQFRRAPGFLRFAPIAIGLGDLEAQPDEVDFRGLVEGLRALEIVPIGTTGGSPRMRQAAQSAGLPPLRPVGGSKGGEDESAPMPAAAHQPAPPLPAVEVSPPAPPPPAAPAARPTLVISDPVRSGQRIHAQGSDLIVTATVNQGAEIIADGNIHVYGALRGRAVAGAADDQDARIFALTFDPELVAIAGFYAVRETLGEVPAGRAVQVRLQGEQMRFEGLG
jgi:septum site-determining protein MinC